MLLSLVFLKDSSSTLYACGHRMAKLSPIFTFVILCTVVFPSCLRLTVHGGQTKHINSTSTKTHHSSAKTPAKIHHELQQEPAGKTKENSTNVVRKRTMNTGHSLKNPVHFRSFPKSQKPVQIPASSPFVRSRLSSLRSSRFKPIHIYGSVPFQTFLSALSKSRGQGSPSPPVNRPYTAPSYTQASQEGQAAGVVGSSVRGEVGQFGATADKPLVPRQYPVPRAMPVETQGNFPPMFFNAPDPMSQPFPIEGDFPMVPGNMPYMDQPLEQPQEYPVEHHAIHHHAMHRKGKDKLG